MTWTLPSTRTGKTQPLCHIFLVRVDGRPGAWKPWHTGCVFHVRVNGRPWTNHQDRSEFPKLSWELVTPLEAEWWLGRIFTTAIFLYVSAYKFIYQDAHLEIYLEHSCKLIYHCTISDGAMIWTSLGEFWEIYFLGCTRAMTWRYYLFIYWISHTTPSQTVP